MPAIVDEHGNELEGPCEGFLVSVKYILPCKDCLFLKTTCKNSGENVFIVNIMSGKNGNGFFS